MQRWTKILDNLHLFLAVITKILKLWKIEELWQSHEEANSWNIVKTMTIFCRLLAMMRLIGARCQVGLLFKWDATAGDKCSGGGGGEILVDIIMGPLHWFKTDWFTNILLRIGLYSSIFGPLFQHRRMVMMAMIKFYSNETVASEWARGIFCDINVHLGDKFEKNFGGILRKLKTIHTTWNVLFTHFLYILLKL